MPANESTPALSSYEFDMSAAAAAAARPADIPAAEIPESVTEARQEMDDLDARFTESVQLLADARESLAAAERAVESREVERDADLICLTQAISRLSGAVSANGLVITATGYARVTS
jgi:hypothetical protein